MPVSFVAASMLFTIVLVIAFAAILVALPTEVTTPVKLALVVTVAALPVVDWFKVGKSPATAIVNAPVVVVDFKMPVASALVPAL